MDNSQHDILVKDLIRKIDQDKELCLLCKIDESNPYFIEIISSNKKFNEYFGYDPKNIIGESFDSILYNDDDNLETIIEYNNVIKKISRLSQLNFTLKIDNSDSCPEDFSITFKSTVKDGIKYCIFVFLPNSNGAKEYNRNTSFGEKNLVHNLERALRNEKLLRISSDLMLKDEVISEISYRALKVLCSSFRIDRAILCQFDNYNINLICEFHGDGIKSMVDNYSADKKDDILKRYFDFHNSSFSQFFHSKETENMMFEDIVHDRLFYDIEDIYSKFHIASQFCVSSPINEDSNMALFLHQTNIKKWNNEEIEIINTISNQLSVAIQKSIYLDKVMESNRELLKKSIALKNSLNEEKKMRMIQNEFIAMASHEFKTPLQIIDSSREVLSRKLINNKLTLKNGEDNLSKIKNAILRLHSLISSTLDLSQIAMSKGDLDVNMSIVSIQNIINDIIKQNNEIYTKKNVKIELDIKKLPKEYSADQKMLDHCFTNIIGNAVKYSPENSTVKILGAILEDKILVKILDNGIGIPKTDLDKIGEKFYRAKNTLKISGTGIGLYLTKYFIKLHDCEVLIQSVEGKGTEVTIILPIKSHGD